VACFKENTSTQTLHTFCYANHLVVSVKMQIFHSCCTVTQTRINKQTAGYDTVKTTWQSGKISLCDTVNFFILNFTTCCKTGDIQFFNKETPPVCWDFRLLQWKVPAQCFVFTMYYLYMIYIEITAFDSGTVMGACMGIPSKCWLQ
jgi:hypothetical protein